MKYNIKPRLAMLGKSQVVLILALREAGIETMALNSRITKAEKIINAKASRDQERLIVIAGGGVYSFRYKNEEFVGNEKEFENYKTLHGIKESDTLLIHFSYDIRNKSPCVI